MEKEAKQETKATPAAKTPSGASKTPKAPLTENEVRALIGKRSLTPRQTTRLLFYYLADSINGTPNPLVDREAVERIYNVGVSKMDGKASRVISFYMAVLEVFNRERTCLQRRAFRDARKELLTPLCLQAMGGKAAELDCGRQAQARIQNAAREGNIFLSTGKDVDAIDAVLSDADFADRYEDEHRLTPYQLVRCYISEFYAQRAVLDIAQDVYGIPELGMLRHPYELIPKCEATVNVYNAIGKEFYHRNPQASPELYPPINLDALRPNPQKLATAAKHAKLYGSIDSIAVLLNTVQGIKIWTFINN